MNDFNNKKILITGGAGFIGFHLIKHLLDNYKNLSIVSIDNINDYYDVSIKEWRLNELDNLKYFNNYEFYKIDISNKNEVNKIFSKNKFDIVVNLAAQAGVRYSIENPDVYVSSNIIGFYNILEECRNYNVEHLVFASSSSVYGDNDKIPYSEKDKTDTQVSLYAATKKSNESMAHAYSKLYGIPITGLRFFTVYGPAGRPDMAYFKFTNKLLNNEKIQIFNYGNCKRDFTYIDDIVNGVVAVMKNPPGIENNANIDKVPYEIYNIGNGEPVDLMAFVRVLKNKLIEFGLLPDNFSLDQHTEYLPMQPGDVKTTYSDTSKLENKIGYKPVTSLEVGLHNFVEWYQNFFIE